MKKILLVFITLFSFKLVAGQVAPKKDSVAVPIEKKDNYTIQHLILFNDKKEILMMKNEFGWHTPVIRSNESQSIKEALDSMAGSFGYTIHSLKLAGLYTHKFTGLADHKEVSFRSHYTAIVKSGELIQPKDGKKEYQWIPIKEALEKITFSHLKIQTTQIVENPKTLWGGTFLIIWEGDKFIRSEVLEPPYALR